MTDGRSVALRAAVAADLACLMALEEEAFASDRLQRRAMAHAIASPTVLSLVAEEDGDLAGYALVQVRRGSRVGRVTSVAVRTGFAGRGIGRDLLAGCERLAARWGCGRLRLEVRADNDRAVRLYERAGYARLATIPDYYEDGAAALRLEKPLGDATPERA